jgi:hypothetical protein
MVHVTRGSEADGPRDNGHRNPELTIMFGANFCLVADDCRCMIDTSRFIDTLSQDQTQTDIPSEPTKDDLRAVVQRLKSEGLCGRRIAEHRLGPYFITSERHGQREIELLDEIIAEEYEGTDLCIETRSSQCSRLRGGCKGNK